MNRGPQGASPPLNLQGGKSRISLDGGKKHKKQNPYSKARWAAEAARAERLAQAVELVTNSGNVGVRGRAKPYVARDAPFWSFHGPAGDAARGGLVWYPAGSARGVEEWHPNDEDLILSTVNHKFGVTEQVARENFDASEQATKKRQENAHKADSLTRADKIRRCRHFEVATDEDGNLWRWSDDGAPVINTKTECGHRLCPKCQRRDSAKRAKEVAETMRRVGDGQATIFATFTRRASVGEPLHEAMRIMKRALERMRRHPAWSCATRGSYVKIEIEFSSPKSRQEKAKKQIATAQTATAREKAKEFLQEAIKSTGSWWHVHAHMLITLHRDAKGRVIYLHQQKNGVSDGKFTIQELWRRALGVSEGSNEGFVSVERIRRRGAKEITKYIAKPVALDEGIDVICELVRATMGAHLVMRWGCWHREDGEGEGKITSIHDLKPDRPQVEQALPGDLLAPKEALVDIMEGRIPAPPPPPVEDEEKKGEVRDFDDLISDDRYMYVRETGKKYKGAINSVKAPFIWRDDESTVENMRSSLEEIWETGEQLRRVRLDKTRVHHWIVDDADDFEDDRQDFSFSDIFGDKTPEKSSSVEKTTQIQPAPPSSEQWWEVE